MNPTDFLPAGVSQETAISVIAGLGTFTTLVSIARAFVPHDPMRARIKAHARRRSRG